MSKPPIHVTGIEEIDRYFDGLSVAVARKPMRKGTRDVAKIVLSMAKEEAPWRFGDLAASLRVKAVSYSKHRPTFVATSVTTGQGWFKGDQYYGGFLEFGTKDRKHKSGKSVGAITKERWDFLRPSLYAFIERKRQVFIQAVREWISQQKGAVN